MKTVIVKIGRCHTCGNEVVMEIDEEAFITFPDGNDVDQICVSGHCGVPGHNMYSRYVSRDEFDAAADGGIIE